MAPHSSVLAWRIPEMAEPGGLPSMGVTQSRTRLTRFSSSSRLLWVFFFSKCIAAWFIYMETYTYSEKAMAPYSSTFAWKIPWTEEPGGLQSMGSLESDTTEWLHFHFSLSCIGEGNGNPLQCSCLENPRDGGAWWTAVYGVAQSRTRLKWLSIA